IRREAGELLPGEQHHEDVVGDHHAGRGLVGELRIEGEAQAAEELDRALEVAHRQIDEDLAGHRLTPRWTGHPLVDCRARVSTSRRCAPAAESAAARWP